MMKMELGEANDAGDWKSESTKKKHDAKKVSTPGSESGSAINLPMIFESKDDRVVIQ